MKKNNSVYIKIGIVFILSIIPWLFLFKIYGEDYSRETHTKRTLIIFVLTVLGIVFFKFKLPNSDISTNQLTFKLKNLSFFIVGILAWLIPAAICTIFLLAANSVYIESIVSNLEVVKTFLLLLVLVFFYEALPEELIYRGFIYSSLTKLVHDRWVILIQAILFTLWGFLNGGENSIERSLLFFTMAIILGNIRYLTSSVWACIGFHFVFQVFAQFFGSVGGVFETNNIDTLTIFAFVVAPAVFSLPVLKYLLTTKYFRTIQ